MKVLPPVTPSPEQLVILSHNKPGVLVLRGAAGSGKTTTALLRLKQQCRVWLNRRDRLGLKEPVRVLVLTYNRTLEGYISELATAQVAANANLDLVVSTFSKWARELLLADGHDLTLLGNDDVARLLAPLVAHLGIAQRFATEEIDYIMGRFPHDDFEPYLRLERRGRGRAPRVDAPLRRRLLDEVVLPYNSHKRKFGVVDWNDVAFEARHASTTERYDVVIIDEAQDFSANQMRAVLAHLADPASVTVVMDAVQRIYPRGFTWAEVGLDRLAGSMTLKVNHRNTREIAAFARPLVEGLPVDDDGALPDFTSCIRSGPKPWVLSGMYSQQVDWVLRYLVTHVDMSSESVVFLQPLGGQWFDYLRGRLHSAGLPPCDLTRSSMWPSGPEEIALCTFHSAKGLEFDHVIMLGLNSQVTPHVPGTDDVSLDGLRRLIAMGIGRARESVIIGYKPSDPSTIISLLDPATYQRVAL
jgi:superfamily I DNA/RNA helicase